ncbi:MAG: hypothetical protein KatS3mg105_5149 [Gemmatales bacterium]|nr:MAG: hypothetical protein KatS3mg105_5149 [Gemmatales bacterium]GIW97840.1 MAG: hypothetical protein KatS3mg111_1173 [Pirellulaceae bacterium]
MALTDMFNAEQVEAAIKAARTYHQLQIAPTDSTACSSASVSQLHDAKNNYDALFNELDPSLRSIARLATREWKGSRDESLEDEVAALVSERVYFKLHRFEGDSRKLVAWVMRIARNCCVDIARSGARSPVTFTDLVATYEDHGCSGEVPDSDRLTAGNAQGGKAGIDIHNETAPAGLPFLASSDPHAHWQSSVYTSPVGRTIQVRELETQVNAFLAGSMPQEFATRAVFIYALGLWPLASAVHQQRWGDTCSQWPLLVHDSGDALSRLSHALHLLQEAQLAGAWKEEDCEGLDRQQSAVNTIDWDWELEVLEQTQNRLRQRISHALRRNLWSCLLASEIWNWILRFVPAVPDESFGNAVPDQQQMQQILLLDGWVGLASAERWQKWMECHGLENSARANFIDLFSVSPLEGKGHVNKRKLDKIQKWFRASTPLATDSDSEASREGLPTDAFRQLLQTGLKNRSNVDIPVPFR